MRAAFFVSENVSISPFLLVFGVAMTVTMVAMAILSCADSGEKKRRPRLHYGPRHHGGDGGGGGCGGGGGGCGSGGGPGGG